VEHPKVLPTPIILKVTKEMGQHILDNKIIITIGQLLKLALDLSIYLMTTSKQFAHNEDSTSKAIITINFAVIDYQMEIIVMHVGKNMVDVLLDEGSKVNAITDGLKQNLRLPPPLASSIQTYEWLISHLTNHWGLYPIL
jgi:hypothetical protein